MAPALNFFVECRIHAPADRVFTLLTSIDTWPDWNPFVPRAEIVSSPNPAPRRFSAAWAEHSRMAVGHRIKFYVSMVVLGRGHSIPGGSIQRVVTISSPDTQPRSPRLSIATARRIYRVIWIQDSLPQSLLRTTWINEIDEVEGENGTECIYTISETMEGPLAWIVKVLFASKIQEGITLWAHGLKHTAEAV